VLSRNFELLSQMKGSSINFDYHVYLHQISFTAAMDTDMLAVIAD